MSTEPACKVDCFFIISHSTNVGALMKFLFMIIFTTIFTSCFTTIIEKENPGADIIIHNAKVWTGSATHFKNFSINLDRSGKI